MKTRLFCCLPLLGLALSGCADGGGATATAGAAINTHCPCMGEEIDGSTTLDWNGKTVGFCCPPCVDEWKEMTDEEREAALANPGKISGGHDHHDHHDEHGDHAHDSDHGHDAEEVPAEEAAPAPDAAPAE